jgi:hypothetical protein
MAIRFEFPSAVNKIAYSSHMKGLVIKQDLPTSKLTTNLPKDSPGLFCKQARTSIANLPAKHLGEQIKNKIVQKLLY